MPTEQTTPAHARDRCCPTRDAKHNPDTDRRWIVSNELQWGSDPSFCYHGFSCPIGSWTEERLVRNLMRNMATMCNSMSIDFNYEPDPSEKVDHTAQEPEGAHLNGLNLTGHVHGRRSSTPASTSSLSSSSSSGKRKADTPLTDVTDATDDPSTKVSPLRKRKCIQKPGQKLCHCQTEKKRREVISQGYQNLSELVPALANRQYTRKYILAETAKYLVALLEGNDKLRRQRDGLVEQDERDRQDLFEVVETDFVC